MTSARQLPEVGVIGAGRLGASLARSLLQAGIRVRAVASRRTAAARALAIGLRGVQALSAAELCERCELVVLAVPDDAVAALARSLPIRRGQAVVHCSGALGLDVLDPVAAAGGLRGCLHPLQSFPTKLGDSARFLGIHCGVEGDGKLERTLTAIARALGAVPLSLRGVERAPYHAAAVFASNYLVALHAAAEAAFALAGLPRTRARAALTPLSLGAIAAVRAQPLERALTGPLARGDLRTLARHLHALAAAPELRALYLALAHSLLALPLRLPKQRKAAIEKLLSAPLAPARPTAPRGRAPRRKRARRT